jgi:hypothetical protein
MLTVCKVTNIEWETDGEPVDLPKSVLLYTQENFKHDEGMKETISNFLSDNWGWLHNGFDYETLNTEGIECARSMQC